MQQAVAKGFMTAEHTMEDDDLNALRECNEFE
jgi:hypothetical protein